MLADKIEQAPSAIGAAAFRNATSGTMPALMQGYTAWVNAIEAGGAKDWAVGVSSRQCRPKRWTPWNKAELPWPRPGYRSSNGK